MIESYRVRNFKSWQDTGHIRLSPITGFFGTNSSGKTGLIQILLAWKQTIESSDQKRVLHTGDDNSNINLGTFYDLVYQRHIPGSIDFTITWQPQKPPYLNIARSITSISEIKKLCFKAVIEGDSQLIQTKSFFYSFEGQEYDKNGSPITQSYLFGMKRTESDISDKESYELIVEGPDRWKTNKSKKKLPRPIKSYGFPGEAVSALYSQTDETVQGLPDLVFSFENLFRNTFYLGPLREYPKRLYSWSGETPQDVGKKGELVVSALLSSRLKGSNGKEIPEEIAEEVARWLKYLGLVDSFRLRSIAPDRREYEVLVKTTPKATEVLITDVGFGVSQILPVLTLCYYAPSGSTIILEQPEIHLHPSVQAGLADVFIDVIKNRNVQIILESHSEHLLRRLQRRIAEQKIDSTETALYFTTIDEGTSQLQELDIDTFGNIRNWPENFFGDELGDLAAMTEASMNRQISKTI